MASFSIVICTHNPNFILFEQLLLAITRFNNDSPTHEVIIIDNNSNISLKENLIVKDFLELKSNTHLLLERIPGLTAARICGINAAKYRWIVFFDDDNLPDANYLNNALHGIKDYPEVGSWGPGNIFVEYDPGAEEWLYKKKELFQERQESITRFDNQRHWQNCYPYGTGLILKREIALEYSKRVKDGRYTLTDRKGKSLSSGGDVQMVLTGIEMGYYAGVLHDLSLKHIIEQNKANLKYLLRLQYGTASAYVKAYNQVFVNQKIPLRKITNYDVFIKIYSLYRIYNSQISKREFELLKSLKLGELNAGVNASGQKKPFTLWVYEKIINA